MKRNDILYVNPSFITKRFCDLYTKFCIMQKYKYKNNYTIYRVLRRATFLRRTTHFIRNGHTHKIHNARLKPIPRGLITSSFSFGEDKTADGLPAEL